jgi:diguanylate cyclase (GGDEF)-like protein/PAS domain S-box-containing protein
MPPAIPSLNDPSFFQRLIEAAEEGVWVIDADSRTVYMNARMAQLLGGTVDGLHGSAMWDFVPDSSKSNAHENIERRKSGVSETHEFLFRRLDGTHFWAELSAAPLASENGSYAGCFAFVSDISWRKAAEQAISESERTFREVFERSQAVKLMIDPETGAIVAANAAARAYYGYDETEFGQINIRQINILSQADIDTELARARREERNYFLFRHRLKSGAIHDVEVHSNPISVGGRTLLYSIIHNIDRQRTAERELGRIRFVVEHAHLSMMLIDVDGRVRYANAGSARLLGRLRADIVGRRIWEFGTDVTEENWPERWRKTKTAGEQSFRTMVSNPDGLRHPVEVQASHMAFDGEEFIVAYSRDIQEQVKAESLLSLQHDVLVEQAAGYPLEHVLDRMMRQVETLLPEVRGSILLLQGEQLFHCVAPRLDAAYTSAINGVHIGPSVGCCGTAAYFNRTIESTDIAGDPRWEGFHALAAAHQLAACWSTPIRATDGRVLGTFALYYRDRRGPDPFTRRVVEACAQMASIAIEHHEAQSRVHKLAFYDALTGLPNRTLLADRIELALAAAARNGSMLAVLFFDLDRFKTINDSLGHAIGDRLLQTVAQRLTAVVRDSDTVCRLGGDEFVLLLPNCDSSGAAAVAEKLIAAAAERIDIDDLPLNGSASLGIAMYPDDGRDYDTLLKHADTAMYRAKERGRSAYCFYRHDMNEHASERLEVEAALRSALQLGQLRLHYQPQITIADGSVYGLEALVRWQHPEWGMVSPARFIPVAEDSGLIDAVGAWVLNEACRQMAEWQRQDIAPPRISVNLSVREFRHGNVPAQVADVLARHGLPSHRLTLEITESLMMEREDNTVEALHRLDQMGVTLAVDDFGTGYSSLGYLKRFPVSELKLDQSFVRDLSDDPEDRALASAVVRIGQSLKLKVVAEGVETAEQLAFLRDEGCEVAQGYHFARPMPAEALSAWLAGRLQPAD